MPCARWLMIERRSGLVWLHQGLGVEARLETEALQVRFSRGAQGSEHCNRILPIMHIMLNHVLSPPAPGNVEHPCRSIPSGPAAGLHCVVDQHLWRLWRVHQRHRRQGGAHGPQQQVPCAILRPRRCAASQRRHVHADFWRLQGLRIDHWLPDCRVPCRPPTETDMSIERIGRTHRHPRLSLVQLANGGLTP